MVFKMIAFKVGINICIQYRSVVQKRSTAVEIFQTLVEQDLVTLGKKIERTSFFSKDNLSETERSALKALRCWRKLVIRNADKGGSVVFMNAVDYRTEALHQLGDASTYRVLTYNPTLIFK